MKVLALDTALSGCSVALAASGRITACRRNAEPRGQAENLLGMLEATLREAAFRYADLDLIAVTIGPGSFSGLRIGLATARGLALASGRPLRGIGTLEALAGAVPTVERAGRSVVAAIEAGRGEIYLQSFDAAGTPLAPPRAIARDQAVAALPSGPLVVVGSGIGAFGPALAGPDCIASSAAAAIDAAVVAGLAMARGLPPAGSPPPAPLYLRPPDARLPDSPR